jgi:hypothetical protein
MVAGMTKQSLIPTVAAIVTPPRFSVLHSRPRRRAIAAFACVLAVLATLGGAEARADSGRVETGTFPIELHQVFEPESTICGFPIIADLSGEGTFQVHLDEQGNFLSGHVLFRVTGTLSANGISLRFGRADNQFFELDGTVTEVGLVGRDFGPGVGVVLMDRGRLVWTSEEQVVFEAGPHPQLHGDVGELCAVLTP